MPACVDGSRGWNLLPFDLTTHLFSRLERSCFQLVTVKWEFDVHVKSRGIRYFTFLWLIANEQLFSLT